MQSLAQHIKQLPTESSTQRSRRQFLRCSTLAAAMLALSQRPALADTHDTTGNAMAAGRPSATAQGAALLRAAHQIIDQPTVFADPFALEIIGVEGRQSLAAGLGRYKARHTLRAFVALRSRFAEDQLTHALARGVEQYVVLGAGLDTYACRNTHPRLQVFEVDHPASQQWKRARLAQAQIPVPRTLTFAPVDFETRTLADGLQAAGFDARKPAFFSLLGVAVYLTEPAQMGTLGFIAGLAPGSEIVFSYSVTPDLLTAGQNAARTRSAQRVAAIGEPWISHYHPQTLAAGLKKLGFDSVRDFGGEEANAQYFSARADNLHVSDSSRLMIARV
jgi:methyltransferase (TIGR00027 family)